LSLLYGNNNTANSFIEKNTNVNREIYSEFSFLINHVVNNNVNNKFGLNSNVQSNSLFGNTINNFGLGFNNNYNAPQKTYYSKRKFYRNK